MGAPLHRVEQLLEPLSLPSQPPQGEPHAAHLEPQAPRPQPEPWDEGAVGLRIANAIRRAVYGWE